jgi:Cd2+/Zn2+-exporting ATPase
VALLLTLLGTPSPVTNALYVLALGLALFPIARNGWNTLRINREFNIDLLMTIAAIGAMFIGEYLEAATVIFLFAIGEALEGYTADQARSSLRGLIELAPRMAIRLDEDGESVISVDDLEIEDRILVKSHENIPMDGIVLSGESYVNQAPITGESVPVYKSQGEVVYAGTVNGSGVLTLQVTRRAEDNTLSRLIQLVEEAQSVRAPSQRLINEFAQWYTPLVVVLAILTATLPPLLFGQPFLDLGDGAHGWLYRALALLVISCPCALVISAPVTVISAITSAARRGVLIKGGIHLENLGRIKAIAFDKTGTLTQGEPHLITTRAIDCTSLDGHCDYCDDMLALAAAVEMRSTHPLARAIVGAAEGRGVATTYAPAEDVEALAGHGVRGRVADQIITVGSHRYFDQHYGHSADLCTWIDAAEADGQTTMLLHDDKRVRGFLSVGDTVRSESSGVVAQLKKQAIETFMLTGDNATVAHAIGQQVGVDHVRANLLPEDKVENVRSLLSDFGKVAMVGDGVNDAPALAAATVGIAMGGAGSAQAMETADVVLMADDLNQLPAAIRLSRFARQLIRQNVVLSVAMKGTFMLLAVMGLATLWMAILADVGMSLVVTLNGMRPLRD